MKLLIKIVTFLAIFILFIWIFNIWQTSVLKNDHTYKNLAKIEKLNFPTVKLPKNTQAKTFRVLVIDGGGIRGIIPLEILKYLEQKTGKPISELFDLVVSTSVGSIITSALLIPDQNGKPRYTAAQAIKIFSNNSKLIFKRNWEHSTASLFGYVGSKYSGKDKGKILYDLFGNLQFDQLLLPSVIAAYALTSHKPIIFDNWHQPFKDQPVWSLVQGATAAPTYFPPYTLVSYSNNIKHSTTIIDAGIYVNDPAMIAFIRSLILFPQKEYIIVDLGTGIRSSTNTGEEEKYWGKVQWLKPFIHDALSAQNVYTSRALNNIALKGLDQRLKYFNFDTIIPEEHFALDNISNENINTLHEIGKNMVILNQDELDQIVKILSNSQ